MDIQNYKFFDSKLLKWVISFGVIVAVGIIYAYGVKLTGNWFIISNDFSLHLSDKSSNWGDFGSLLSGAFTFLAALSSFATLIFLLQQQKKNDLDHIEKLKLERDIHDKNNTHFNHQKELINFEMYKIHKDMFDNQLSNIERSINSGLSFVSRSEIYKGIFPSNGFYHFSGKADLNTENLLNSVVEEFKSLLLSLSSVNDNLSAHRFIAKFHTINRLLGLRGDSEFKEFDVIYRGRCIGLNIFTIRDSLDNLSLSIDELLKFSENKYMSNLSYPAGWYSSIGYFIVWAESPKNGKTVSMENSIKINASSKNQRAIDIFSHIIILFEELIKNCNYESACYGALKRRLLQYPIFRATMVNFESMLSLFAIDLNNELNSRQSMNDLDPVYNKLSSLLYFISQSNIWDVNSPIDYEVHLIP